MIEQFDLRVIQNGKELTFTSQLLPYGFVHKFKVGVNGHEMMFEPDL